MTTSTGRRDEGFTLTELLIAMLIMGIAVAALVTAMAGLVTATTNHRGHATNDAVAHDYAEAIAQKVVFTSTLSAAVDQSANQICIDDSPDLFLTDLTKLGSSDMYVVLDRETMKVTGPSTPTHCSSPSTSWRLNVQRGSGGTIADSHSVSTRVQQLLACPSVNQATAAGSSSGVGYLDPDGTAAYSEPSGVTASITGISYWNPSTGTYNRTQADCWTAYTAACLDVSNNPNYDLFPECDAGFEQVSIQVVDVNKGDGATGTNCSNGALCTTTQVLIRRGSG